jgi:dATP pyrophosphohydrolase
LVIPVATNPHYKRPESVLVLVCTRGGEVLLLRRRQPVWFWQSVTGSLHWNETPRQAALRELFEETGLRAGANLVDWHYHVEFSIVAPWKKRYAPDAHVNREHWFLARLASRRLVRLNPGEHREYRWLAPGEAWRRASSWTNRRAITAIQRCGC